MTDQPSSPPVTDPAKPSGVPALEAEASEHEDAALAEQRRLPGEPHPYMLQRNPPNLWILVALTIFSLVLTVVILTLTVLL